MSKIQLHSCTCITYETVDICLFELQEQLLLEPMFEVPGSDIVRVLVEEDTARGYHPALYQYNDPSSSEGAKADQPPADESSPDSNSEIKTSVLWPHHNTRNKLCIDVCAYLHVVLIFHH